MVIGGACTSTSKAEDGEDVQITEDVRAASFGNVFSSVVMEIVVRVWRVVSGYVKAKEPVKKRGRGQGKTGRNVRAKTGATDTTGEGTSGATGGGQGGTSGGATGGGQQGTTVAAAHAAMATLTQTLG